MARTRAALYARFSCEKQRDASIEDQLFACNQYCDRMGYEVVAQYCDYAISGRSDDRPQFQMMVAEAAERKFDVIVVWNMSRFARNAEDLYHHTYVLRKCGVELESTQEDIAGDSIAATTTKSIHALFAQIRSQESAIDTKRGMLGKARKCQYLGDQTFGYSHEGDEIVLDEEEAPLARKLHEDFIAGKSIGELAKWLGEIGVRTSHGSRPNYDFVRRILKDERYCGVYQWGWEKDSRGRKVLDERGEPIRLVRVEDGMPAIVSRECKEEVLRLLGKRRRYDLSWKYPLTGKLYCGVCGEHMNGESYHGNGGEYRRYRCAKRRRPCVRNHCQSLEELVARGVRDLLADEAACGAVADMMVDYQSSEAERSAIRAARKELADQIRTKSNLLDAVGKGLPFEDVRERIADLDCQMREKQAYIEKLEASRSEFTREQVLAFLAAVSRGYATDSELLECAVSRVWLYDEKVVVVMNVSAARVSRAEIEEALSPAEPGHKKQLEPLPGFEQIVFGSPSGGVVEPIPYVSTCKNARVFVLEHGIGIVVDRAA